MLHIWCAPDQKESLKYLFENLASCLLERDRRRDILAGDKGWDLTACHLRSKKGKTSRLARHKGPKGSVQVTVGNQTCPWFASLMTWTGKRPGIPIKSSASWDSFHSLSKKMIPKENLFSRSDQENKDNLNTKEMVRPSSSPTAVRTGTWKTFSWEPNRSGRYDPRRTIPCKTLFAMPMAPSL